ncbi:MAG: GUN4 domain-containing protein [Cyanobacteria bacterium P01_A01_bin.135]
MATFQEEPQGSGHGLYRTSLERRRACYEQAVRTAIANQFPLGVEDRQTLHRLQQALKLSDEVAQSINRQVSSLAADEEARYQGLLLQYEQALEQSLGGGSISPEEQQRLTQQLSQWGISRQDAELIEAQVQARYRARATAELEVSPTRLELPLSHGEAVGTAPASEIQPWGSSTNRQLAPRSVGAADIETRHATLEELLRGKHWQAADHETYRCLLVACDRVDEGWLDSASVQSVGRADLLAIDGLWHRYTEGQFSFKTQREISLAVAQAQGSQPASPLEFGQQVGWLLWDRPLLGFKYYRQLTFDRTAPTGHLPAKWFWEIPLGQSLKCGGLTRGRGGCAKDDGLLATLHQVLDELYPA